MDQAAGESSFSAESLKRSWWFLFTLVPFGLLAFAAFTFIWRRTRRREWRNSAIAYGLVFWIAFVIAAIEDLPEPLRQAGGMVLFFGMVVPPIHALVIRPRYLEMVRSGHAHQEPPSGAVETTPAPAGGAAVPTVDALPRRPLLPAPPIAAAREIEVSGWARRWGRGRVRYWLGWVVVAVMVLGGLGFLGEENDRLLGLATISFGIAVALTLPQLRTWRRRGDPVIGAVGSWDDTPSLHFRFSRSGTGLLPYAGALSAIAVLLLLLDPGDSPFSHPVVRGLCLTVVVAMVLVGARTLRNRKDWFIALTEDGITAFQYGSRSYIPWGAVRDVIAFEYSRVGRPVGFSQPHVGLFVERMTDVELKERRFLARFNRSLMGDVAFALDLLAVDPELLFVALRYYWKNLEARSELGTEAAVDRVRRRDFDDPSDS